MTAARDIRLLRDLPIKRKLTIITMLTTGVALLLACVAFASYEQFVSRASLVEDLAGSAGIVGDNSAAALSFNDPASAELTLKSLDSNPNIIAAAIYSNDGRIFAKYLRVDAPEAFSWPNVELDGHAFADDSLVVFRGIDIAGERSGAVFIQSDLGKLQARLWRYSVIALLVMAGACGVAFLLSAKLQIAITGPISHLAAVVGVVGTQKDYSVRATKHGDNELGDLIDGFNDMLSQIQQRDHALEEARGTLEGRVQRRTQELARSLSLLNATLESTRDGIVARQFSDGLVCYNSQYQGMWNVPPELLLRGKEFDAERIAWIAAQVKDPDAYVASMERMLAQPDNESFDIVELIDGRIFERCIKPQRVDGEIVGLVTNFRDITASRHAERELEQMHSQLRQASRQAGMTEIATNVLHNVGNVLNSVNVSATLVADSINNSRIAGLAKAVAVMREHEADLGAFLESDPRGKHMLPYLAQLAEHLSTDRQASIKELNFLRQNIDHIREIVSMQQTYARGSSLEEAVDVTELVEDGLRMNTGALTRHRVEVIREFQEVPRIKVDKHKVLQVLVNLVRNAKYACDDSGRADKLVRVRTSHTDDVVRIAVIDNGIGIPAENLTRIFSHGFTTRASGHGFGLHSGALTAKELGGALHVHSDGAGHGATFTLELPLVVAVANP